MKRRRTQKKKKQSRKTRHKRIHHISKSPNALIDFSPVSSPGPNSPTFSLTPNTQPNTQPNTPITKHAKELAKLYPNRGTMIQRSSSFNNGFTTENFYTEFEKLFPEKNGPAYP